MAELHCSFCGKKQRQVKRLIAGPGVYICEACVDLCQEILDEERVGVGDVPESGHLDADKRSTGILTGEALREALENLAYRERRVLELRYGLFGEHPRTLNEVATTFNLTREGIRRIEHQALENLQSLCSKE